MSRMILSKLALGVALVVASAPALTVYADNTPSAKDMAEAKKAFGEGKKLHDAGKLPEAIEKFQKSYFLSKNPLLLYNVALTMEEAGMADIAVGYYKKFLSDAPAEAAQRPEAEASLKALEAKLGGGGTMATSPHPTGGPTGPAVDTGTKPVPEVKGPIVVKPAGTYAETDFQHQVVDTAPPGKPLDITAYVPEDSGWTVTLAFRTAGEGKFTMKTMKWRYKELVGRIPAPKMIGDSVQYYVEAKDSAGAVVARSAKSTSPNLVTLEAGATPRFYPDFSEDGEVKLTGAQVRARDDADNPLTGKVETAVADDPPLGTDGPVGPVGPTDTGPVSKQMTYLKWGTTAGSAALLAGSLVFYLQAGSDAQKLVDDTTLCGTPPCRPFDQYDRDLQSAGKRSDTLSKVFLGGGLVVGVAAGYFWYKTLKHKHARTTPTTARRATAVDVQWAVVPALGEGFAGASATVGF